MARCHLIQRLLHGLVAVSVKHRHHPVNTALLQQFPYTAIIGIDGFERKQFVRIGVLIFGKYSERFLMQGYSYCLCLAFLCPLRHVFHETVFDIFPCQTVQVTDTTTDIAVEDKDVTDDLQQGSRRQVSLIEDIAFLNGEVERNSIHRDFASILQEYFIACIAHFLAPVQKHTKKIHRVYDGCA